MGRALGIILYGRPGGGTGASPASLGAGIEFDAARGLAAGVDADGEVSPTWDDQGVDGYINVGQVGTVTGTTLRLLANGIGGSPALEFGGAFGTSYRKGMDAPPATYMTGPATFYAVCRSDSWATERPLVQKGTVDAISNGSIYLRVRTDGRLEMGRQNSDWANVVGTQVLATGTDYVIIARVRAGFVDFFVNGAAVDTVATAVLGNTTTNGADVIGIGSLRFGGSDSFSHYWDGLIAEVGFFGSALSDADVTALRAYFLDKYSI